MTSWTDIKKIIDPILEYLGNLDVEKTYIDYVEPTGIEELKKIYHDKIENFNKWFSKHPNKIDLSNTDFIKWVIEGYPSVRDIITLLNYQIDAVDKKLDRLLSSAHENQKLVTKENVNASKKYTSQIRTLREYLVKILGCGGNFLSWYYQWVNKIVKNLPSKNTGKIREIKEIKEIKEISDRLYNLCLENRRLLLNR